MDITARRYFPPHKQKRQLMRPCHVTCFYWGGLWPGAYLSGSQLYNSCVYATMILHVVSSLIFRRKENPFQRAQIDDLGHFVFRDVPGGEYVMVLHLPGREVIIEELAIG